MIAVVIDGSASPTLRTAVALARERNEPIVLVAASQNGSLGARADELERLCRALAAEGVRVSAEVSRADLADFVQRERPTLVLH